MACLYHDAHNACGASDESPPRCHWYDIAIAHGTHGDDAPIERVWDGLELAGMAIVQHVHVQQIVPGAALSVVHET